ncbi:MAG: RecQ family ATP-dependent DNA helicase [Alcaligenaceae bacterium]|nr:RecQ family ATP-dependent DNA helicase [Alcaligenaceae bacterium]
MFSSSQPKGFVFDLEVVPPKTGQRPRITMVGALRPDLNAELETKVSGEPLPALRQMDELSSGADFVLGHNIIEHDLPILNDYAPQLSLLALPRIDTLRLSPLAFPQNPYHRLIKDYKLVRDSLNSPLSDCRSTWTLFQDQRQAFSHLQAIKPEELSCYQALLAPSLSSDLARFFASLSGHPPLPLDEVKCLIPQLLQETDPLLKRDLKVCRTRLTQLLEHDLQNKALHWPLAYALAWLRVSGGNSVLAPWVRHQFPAVNTLISELRDQPCGQEDCQYCQTTHDPLHELRRYFGFPDFRYESEGESLQRDIVFAGMRGQHVLAILATGGGKSLCYQVPALNRFHRNGSLTIIISPLQSLMKDQVDGLLEHNIQCAATLNGLLTMPERAEVLEKVQMGDIGILLVSPEQFRNRAFRRAISQRQIGAWIFDEAHCLSKWGSDFRPDYLYVSRFIKEYGSAPLAPVGCFTATAKPDVLVDIQHHFAENLGIEFKVFPGGHERTNLHFDVLPCSRAEKWQRTHSLLREHLDGTDGGAVVFVASRKNAEDLSEFLIGKGWACRHFHAGLEPHTKTDIQDDFKAGQLKVITATNAFGMGVDKKDIRLVVHADISSSLENYLQEAGRAGRDQDEARCVLLYDPQDIETQFGMTERSRLSLRDIRQILRKLRSEHNRRKGGKVVITAGEILLDETVETSFSADDRDAETKVITAVAWLERGEYLKREENHTQIFPARLAASREEAEQLLKNANLPARRLEEYSAILRFLYGANTDERINTDHLMALTSLTSEEVVSVLRQMEDMGLLINDSQITLYLRHGVVGASKQRLERALTLESALFEALREHAPDATDGQWQDLSLPALASELKTRTGLENVLPLQVLRLLRSLTEDQSDHYQHRTSFEIRQINHDYLKLRIKGSYSWKQIEEFGEKRRALAAAVLAHLIGKLPPGSRNKDLLVETSFGQLMAVIESDLELVSRIPPKQRHKAVSYVLLYLHRQDILTLNHGMTVMRRAMTIDVNPQDPRKTFRREDYQRLDEHYREKRMQTHVMREYAEVALKEMTAALQLVLDYFTDSKQAFLNRYFSGRENILELATSEESWRSIVSPLNDAQRPIVMDDNDQNRLVLAGPGSGKTRVIVHRIAYLLRVRRVPPSSIVALTFNRHAAIEIRKRLSALVGTDAYGVSVLTYHSMAMRLTGIRFDNHSKEVDEQALKNVLSEAVELLEGKREVQGEDDLREQLLRGYRYILVDEYQDIDDLQYRLVGALAGRHVEEDGRLCILAVGDDDQNIYAWRNTSNRYIERFREDYEARTSYLVDNYRSSRRIIEAANQIIETNTHRLKAEHPIRIDPARAGLPAGGEWESLDPQRRGCVQRQLIHAADQPHGNLQAQAALQELMRLQSLNNGNWDDCAILARTRHYLYPIQAFCEQRAIPYFLASDKESALPRTRDRHFIAAIDQLRSLAEPLNPLDAWQRIADSQAVPDPEWQAFFQTAFAQIQEELGAEALGGNALIDWLYDYARELRQQPRQGLYLGTVHSAKGLEFPHVVLLDGGWTTQADRLADERRLYYVGMTRAEQTLTLCEFKGNRTFSASLADDTHTHEFQGRHLPELNARFHQLPLSEIDLGYAGRHTETHAIHAAIAGLRAGSPLILQQRDERHYLLDETGNIVGRLAKSFQPPATNHRCEVAAILVRFSRESQEDYRQLDRCERWEVVVPVILSGEDGCSR